jgi:hypothetical protein
MVKGLAGVKLMLSNKFSQVEREVKNEIARTGDMIRRDADLNASSIGFFDSNGVWVRIAGKIHGSSFNSNTGYRIWVNAGDMAAYLEFGTGSYYVGAGYSKEWQDIAFEFFVNGEGTLPSRPYLYPAWVKNTTGMVARMRLRLNKI